MHSFIRLKRFVLFAVSVGCAALLAACASPDSRRVPAPLTEFKPSLELKQAWKTNIGNAKPYLFRPAVVDNAVYAAAANGAVVKMDASRGAVIWRAYRGRQCGRPGVCTGAGGSIALEERAEGRDHHAAAGWAERCRCAHE